MPAGADLFKQFPNQFFVETGTWHGYGLDAALEAGFPNIRSVELSTNLFNENSRRFADRSNVTLHHGSSSEKLWEMIQDVDVPITFWLDAHYSEGDTAKGEEMTPVLLELKVIAQHPIKTHTILIDDVRCFGQTEFDFITEDEAKRLILEINPQYRFSYADGHVPNDILIARVEGSTNNGGEER